MFTVMNIQSTVPAPTNIKSRANQKEQSSRNQKAKLPQQAKIMMMKAMKKVRRVRRGRTKEGKLSIYSMLNFPEAVKSTVRSVHLATLSHCCFLNTQGLQYYQIRDIILRK